MSRRFALQKLGGKLMQRGGMALSINRIRLLAAPPVAFYYDNAEPATP